jgi:PAS domain S-box-containing protein
MDLAEELGAAFLVSAGDVIISADTQGVIRFWNSGAERMFGYSSTEAIGQSLDLIVPEALRKRHWEGYEQVMRTGQSRYDEGDVLEVPEQRKDGKRISLEFTIVPLRRPDGALNGMDAVLRDVTARFEELRSLRKKAAGGLHLRGSRQTLSS